jgi:hypothetical protein
MTSKVEDVPLFSEISTTCSPSGRGEKKGKTYCSQTLIKKVPLVAQQFAQA